MDEPQRIVSLISSATEVLFGIGAEAKLVAVGHECDYPAAARALPRATCSLIDSSLPSGEIDEQVARLSSEGAALYELDSALLRRLLPDLIVTQSQCDVCAVRYADVVGLVKGDPRLAATKVLGLNPSSLEEVLDDIRRIGEATGRTSSAANFREILERRIASVAERTAGLGGAQRPRVACIEWIEPLMLAANWTPQLLDLAGGTPGLAVAGQHSVYGSWDDLLRFDPEVLLVSPCGFDLSRSLQEAERLRTMPGWSSIAAVRNQRTWVIDGNAYLNRPGPRLTDSLEILAHLIQPELFDRPAWSDPTDLPWANLSA